METNVKFFPGSYHREGKIFINPQTKTGLIICERTVKTTTKKPTLFLLQVFPDGSRRYISSLYLIDENQGKYFFDCQGIKYELFRSGEVLNVKEVKKVNA